MDVWEDKYIQLPDLRMHYKTAGKGVPVILLHGFPQFWYTWRHQIPVLSENFQVIVPDLRGYGQTEKPSQISDYQPSKISGDIVSLIRALGYDKAHMVGHDWGGSVGWRIALENPEVLDRLIVLNCPHPYKFAKAIKSNFSQIKKSWYIFFFQIPYLPEWAFKMNGKKILTSMLRGHAVRKDAFTDEDIETFYQNLNQPGAVNAALNYYRAAFRALKDKKPGESDKKIKAPTLLIWGEDDTALGKDLTEGMEGLFEGPFKIEYIPQCSHWVVEEQPEKVSKLILEHLLSQR